MNGAALNAAPTGGFNMNSMMDIIKTQYIMGSFQSAMSSTGMQKHSAILMMVFMMLYEQLSRLLPQFLDYVIFKTKRTFNTTKEESPKLTAPSLEPPKEKPINSFITYTRAPSDIPTEQRVNAILFYICNLPQVKSLRFNGYEFIPSFKEPISIENDIWFQVTNVNENTSFSFSSSSSSSSSSQVQRSSPQETITFKLFSYDHDIKYLHRFVEQLVDQYEQEKKNKLGNEVYYFDQISTSKNSGIPGSKQKLVFFRKSKFYTNRKLENVYFKQSDELIQRVRFFMNRRDWYDAKGVPHTLGIVMYGHPGCGKTSTIKAIANETKRHIFNINLSEIKSKEAFKSLFFSDSVNIMEGNDRMDAYNIAMKSRVYVIEDIDAMNSIVLKRDGKTPNQEETRPNREKEKKPDPLFNMPTREEDGSDELDLSTLLNVLDGIRETPGRIIILSTNYPERLDQALLRPGRFDVMVHFDKHDNDVLIKHVESFYDMELPEEQRKKLQHPSLYRKWTPAEVGQILFCNVHNSKKAVDTLVEKTPQQLFKYSQLEKDYCETPPIQEEPNPMGIVVVKPSTPLPKEENNPIRISIQPSNENPIVSSPKLADISSKTQASDSNLPPELSAEEKQALDTYFFPGLKYFVESPYCDEWQGFVNYKAYEANPRDEKIKEYVEKGTCSYTSIEPTRLALYESFLSTLFTKLTINAVFDDYSEKFSIINQVKTKYYDKYYKDKHDIKIFEQYCKKEEIEKKNYILYNLLTLKEYQDLFELRKQFKVLIKNSPLYAYQMKDTVESMVQKYGGGENPHNYLYNTTHTSIYENIKMDILYNMKSRIQSQLYIDASKKQEDKEAEHYLNPDQAYNVDYTQNNVIMPNLLDANDLSDQCMSYDEAFGEKVMDSTLPLIYKGPNAEPQAMHEKSFSSVHGVGYDGETNDAYRALERKIANDFYKTNPKPPSNSESQYANFLRQKTYQQSVLYDNDDDIHPM